MARNVMKVVTLTVGQAHATASPPSLMAAVRPTPGRCSSTLPNWFRIDLTSPVAQSASDAQPLVVKVGTWVHTGVELPQWMKAPLVVSSLVRPHLEATLFLSGCGGDASRANDPRSPEAQKALRDATSLAGLLQTAKGLEAINEIRAGAETPAQSSLHRERLARAGNSDQARAEAEVDYQLYRGYRLDCQEKALNCTKAHNYEVLGRFEQ